MSICRLTAKGIGNLFQREITTPTKLSYRTTYIVERIMPPPASRFNAKRPRILKARHFIYRTIEDTDLSDPPDLHVVLTSYVEGIGDVGDVISLDPYYARDHLLLQRKADYATPENIEKYTNMRKSRSERAKYSSIHAGMLVKVLSKSTIPVFMNPKEPWTVGRKHIHVAFRMEGFHVPEDAIELPSTPIEGPDSEKESTDFAVYLTINDRERVPIRCRLFHIKPGMETAKLSDELYLDKYEPLLSEQKELLESMPMPEILDDISASISLVEKYRIRYLN
ncbi:39S ribosomal protein L9, mitochondrial-like [Argiope bruennichi]|uniref:39S ribosomal protein L9, mitochondrial-like n=1 Tax=Argiope bruennichi TaxID=94029 RepID=UPI0024941217|nr:39S ribosomal protein L9, mitochondrial-like [Argiope bruennichi]